MLGNISKSCKHVITLAVVVTIFAFAYVQMIGIEIVYAGATGLLLLVIGALFFMDNNLTPSASDAARKASGAEPSKVGLNTANQYLNQGMDIVGAAVHGALAAAQQEGTNPQSVISTIAHVVISNQSDPMLVGATTAEIIRGMKAINDSELISREFIIKTVATVSGAANLHSGFDPSDNAFNAAMELTSKIVDNKDIVQSAKNAGRAALKQKQSPYQIGEAIALAVGHAAKINQCELRAISAA